MSMKKFLHLGLVCLLACFCACSTGRVSVRDNCALDSICNLAMQRRLAVDFNYVTPLQLPPHILTTPYSIVVGGDSVDSQLPYFGEAYRSDYGSTRSPLDFKTRITAYDVVRRRDQVLVRLSVSIQPEQFDFLLSLFANGRASLHVNSNYRQSINFDGDLRQEPMP